MKAIVNGKDYLIRFNYDKAKRCSMCNIFKFANVDSFIPVGDGVAVAGRKDVFNKKIGRKKAFARAVRSFPRTTRILFWNKYFEMTGEPYLPRLKGRN